VVEHPVRSQADLARLRPLEVEDDLDYVLDTVSILVDELDVPLIGFAGAPFTLASYLVEGGPSKSYTRTKAMMFAEEGLWHELLDHLADITLASLRGQVARGASAVQLFDSWAGALHPADYARYVEPHTRRIFEGLADLEVPRIHFGVTTGELLGAMARVGADVVGVDWRVPLADARARVPAGVALQGNLEPAVALGPWELVEERVRDVLDRGGWPRGPHLQPGARGPARDRPRRAGARRRAGPPGGAGGSGDGPRGAAHRHRPWLSTPSSCSTDTRWPGRCSSGWA
jgi:uroporphyrinogen decarboxylase